MPSLRVHIAPVDFDRPEGISIPMHQQDADKAYLVLKSKDDEASVGFEQMHRIHTLLLNIEVNTSYVNNEDLFSCLEMYREIFNSEQENPIQPMTL